MRRFLVILLILVLAGCSDHERFHVQNEGMEPTIKPGDYVIGDRKAYQSVADIRVGHIVVYVIPQKASLTLRRVIALPGDRITALQLDQEAPVLHVNGVPVELFPGIYLRSNDNAATKYGFPAAPTFPFVVPASHIFVGSDDPARGIDSRYYGPVPFSALRAKAISVEGRPLP